MARIAVGVEYDGADFYGWQVQKDGRSVQACLEQAVSLVADESVRVHCAGRTDTGVHATAQVAHFDTRAHRPEHNWILGINSALPRDAAVTWALQVSGEFHARFSAVERAYSYLILCDRARTALYRERVCWRPGSLDGERMDRAAQALVGTHDFSAFRAAGCQAKSPIRTVHSLRVQQRGPWLRIDVRANAFLQHMVRNLAGVLMAVGAGEAELDWPAQVLATRDRTRGGMTAPAAGLYLVDIHYPPPHRLPPGVPVRLGPWASGDSVGPHTKLV
ncbi:MAG: tRNA pseudouridine(38-40) synthase TruA [Pseudomonadota bacterium]